MLRKFCLKNVILRYNENPQTPINPSLKLLNLILDIIKQVSVFATFFWFSSHLKMFLSLQMNATISFTCRSQSVSPNGGRYKSFEDSILLLSFFHCSLKTEYLNKLKVSYIIMQFNKLYHFYRIFTRFVWLTRGFIFFKISAHT